MSNGKYAIKILCEKVKSENKTTSCVPLTNDEGTDINSRLQKALVGYGILRSI